MLFSRDAPLGRRIWYAAGLVAFCLALAGGLYLWQRPFGYDLATYILAARRLAAGEALYPEHVVLGPFGQFFYPPIVAAAFVPFTVAPFGAAVIWMVTLLAIATAFGAVLVRRHAVADRPWAAAAFAFFPPLIWELTLGNVTLVAAALALLAWSRRATPPVAGALLAASITLKPLGVGLVLYCLIARHARVAAWAVGTAVAAIALTWPWLGARWVEYAALVPALATATPGTGSNIVPPILAEGVGRTVVVIFATVVIVVAAIAARRWPAIEMHGAQIALAAGPLFFSTIWYPYLLFALPLLVEPGTWAPAPWNGPAGRAARVAAWVIILAQLWPQPGRAFVLPFVGLVLLLAVAVIAPAREVLRGVVTTRSTATIASTRAS